MVCRGEIWLANLNPVKKNNEMGKIRPVLVFQNDELNHSEYPTTIIIPLTTSLIDDAEPIRMRVKKREKLLQDSDLVITQIRSIDNDRFVEKLASIKIEEMKRVKELFDEVTSYIHNRNRGLALFINSISLDTLSIFIYNSHNNYI